MSKKLVKKTQTKAPATESLPTIRQGDFALIKDGVTEYCTGGIIRSIQRHVPCRVLQVSITGRTVLLSRPIAGWVGVGDVTKVEGPVAPRPVSSVVTPRVTNIKGDELEILLPVTRPWAVDRVCRALALSDVPRGRLILILDAPGCESWGPALEEIGFSVETYETYETEPPDGRLERRARHRAMRRLSQTLVGDGHLLLLEDDTLVPPDVFSKLESTEGSVTGVQVSRHDLQAQIYGIQGFKNRSGVEPIVSCGHFCMLTTGKDYKAAGIVDSDQPVDEAHTSQIRPLSVDWSVVCGHLNENGSVVLPGDREVRVVRDSAAPLHIGALVHMYPPHHNAGAEHMLHAILAEAVRRGHKATVALSQGGRRGSLGIGDYSLDGVSVCETTAALEGVDCIFTHLDRTTDAEAVCTAKNIPCIQLFHNHYQTKLAVRCDLAAYNSRWLAEDFPCTFPSIVIPPPIDMDAYRVKPGQYITLINLSAAKGANMFYALAERFPNLDFLGVKGAYGEQVLRDDLDNVRLIDNTPDVCTVYSQTRVLLVPSIYESYGRVAVEASASGIPVIANATPGLKEALGVTGIFPARKEPLLLETRSELSVDNLEAWADALTDVLTNWKGYSTRAKTLTTDPTNDIARLLGAIQTIVRR